MQIAIIGYGKIGRMIESMALEQGHTIGAIYDLEQKDEMQPEELSRHDVALEFTGPESAFENVSRCLDASLPVVSGSTGWTDRLDELVQRSNQEGTAFFYASNFSLGVNILFHMNRQLATLMNRYPHYHAGITETHHTQKLDAPSGTAITLAEDILKRLEHKKQWVLGETKKPGELPIEAIREGNVPGIHEVTYESEFDILSIRHSAHDRRGFVKGALLAAEYSLGKSGFLTMRDLLDLAP